MIKWRIQRFLIKSWLLSLLLLSLLRRPSSGPTTGTDIPSPSWMPSMAVGTLAIICKETLSLQELLVWSAHRRAHGVGFWGIQGIPAILSTTVRAGHLRKRCGICFISQTEQTHENIKSHPVYADCLYLTGNQSKLLQLHLWLQDSHCQHQPGHCWTICYSRSRCHFSSPITADGYYYLLEVSLPLMADQWARHRSKSSCRSVVKVQQLVSLPFAPSIAAYFPTSSPNSLLIELLLFLDINRWFLVAGICNIWEQIDEIDNDQFLQQMAYRQIWV